VTTSKELSAAARTLGKAGAVKGGRAKTPAKSEAARRNGKLGGRPKREPGGRAAAINF
jgi:hypothetical protein